MKRLLVVEDESLIRRGIHFMVESSGVPVNEILECSNGEEAWALLQSCEIDAVLTDIKMPRMDGVSLAKNIQSMKVKPLIVVISGHADFNYAVDMLRYGVIDYILKPVDRGKLHQVLIKLESHLKGQEPGETEKWGMQALKQCYENESKNKIDEAIRYIKRNYCRPINMAMVSNHVSMNYALFSFMFKQNLGVNFTAYLRTLRMEESLKILLNTNMKIKNIAYKVGYSDVKIFLKTFKQTYGVTPKERRAMNQPDKTEKPGANAKGDGTSRYVMVWSDEFDYDGVPDPNKWTYEVGNHQWANRELQAYSDRPDNVYVKDGKLYIVARKEKDGEREYTSARLTTYGKASWTCGRIEVMAKLPRGKGSWPAIWMLPNAIHEGVRWPLCGEIDIMEHVGRMENQILFSLHSENHNHVKRTQYTTIKPIQGVCDEFHEYAIEWTPEYVEFFVDDISCAKYSINDDASDKSDLSWPFNKPFFLILNIAVGGGLGGPVEDDTLPYVMAIDYVRVYCITNQ